MSTRSDLADDLGGLVNGHPEHVAAALPQLEAIIKQADDVDTLVAAIEALGHAWDPRAAQVLLRYVPLEHPDDSVRTAMARSLPNGVDDEAPEYAAVVAALVQLSTDLRDEVRDWACFGLGQLEADGPVVRDALAACLDDKSADTRCEALVALARLGDARALVACRLALEDTSRGVYLLEVEAAALLADPSLRRSLEMLSRLWSADPPDEFTSPLAEAIDRCSSTTPRS